MKLTVLGSGTSHGVPMIGCQCEVCTSDNPRNKRLRPSILVTTDEGKNILVDTPPEMRIAFLQNHVMQLDSIFYTHSHADHIYGMDDVRTFNYRTGEAMPIFAEANVLADLRRIYEYAFRETPHAGGKPEVSLNEIRPGQAITRGGATILALRVFHGRLPILAYKFGTKFAYVTDVSEIPLDTWSHLENLDLLMLDATRREPHPTHFHLDASLEIIARLRPKQTLLTHLSHDYDHDVVNATLPPGVALAYDTQIVEF